MKIKTLKNQFNPEAVMADRLARKNAKGTRRFASPQKYPVASKKTGYIEYKPYKLIIGDMAKIILYRVGKAEEWARKYIKSKFKKDETK